MFGPTTNLRHKNLFEVTLNPEEGKVEFKGRSIVENSESFFEPVMEWIHR